VTSGQSQRGDIVTRTPIVRKCQRMTRTYCAGARVGSSEVHPYYYTSRIGDDSARGRQLNVGAVPLDQTIVGSQTAPTNTTRHTQMRRRPDRLRQSNGPGRTSNHPTGLAPNLLAMRRQQEASGSIKDPRPRLPQHQFEWWYVRQKESRTALLVMTGLLDRRRGVDTSAVS
jgi:hypothetical protein